MEMHYKILKYRYIHEGICYINKGIELFDPIFITLLVISAFVFGVPLLADFLETSKESNPKRHRILIGASVIGLMILLVSTLIWALTFV